MDGMKGMAALGTKAAIMPLKGLPAGFGSLTALTGISGPVALVQARFSADLILEITAGLRKEINGAIQRAVIGADFSRGIPTLEKILSDAGALTYRNRAEAIFRTETQRVASMATDAVGQQMADLNLDVVKIWRWSGISRENHAAIDGQLRELDGFFDVPPPATMKAPPNPTDYAGGERARWPRWPSLSAANSINCGCMMLFIDRETAARMARRQGSAQFAMTKPAGPKPAGQAPEQAVSNVVPFPAAKAVPVLAEIVAGPAQEIAAASQEVISSALADAAAAAQAAKAALKAAEDAAKEVERAAKAAAAAQAAAKAAAVKAAAQAHAPMTGGIYITAPAQSQAAKLAGGIPKSLRLPDGSTATLLRSSGGSTPGGFYSTDAGKTVLIKWPNAVGQAGAEVVSTALADAMGLPSASAQIFALGDPAATGLVGVIKPSVKFEPLKMPAGGFKSPGDLKGINAADLTDQFVHAALTGNWDAVGLEFDNLVLKDGKPMVLDFGGSLLWRAQGALKPSFFAEVGELTTLRNHVTAPQASTVFGWLSPGEIADRIKVKLATLTDEAIRAAVGRGGFGADIAGSIAKALIARRDYMLAWAKETLEALWKQAAAASTATATKVKVKRPAGIKVPGVPTKVTFKTATERFETAAGYLGIADAEALQKIKGYVAEYEANQAAGSDVGSRLLAYLRSFRGDRYGPLADVVFKDFETSVFSQWSGSSTSGLGAALQHIVGRALGPGFKTYMDIPDAATFPQKALERYMLPLLQSLFDRAKAGVRVTEDDLIDWARRRIAYMVASDHRRAVSKAIFRGISLSEESATMLMRQMLGDVAGESEDALIFHSTASSWSYKASEAHRRGQSAWGVVFEARTNYAAAFAEYFEGSDYLAHGAREAERIVLGGRPMAIKKVVLTVGLNDRVNLVRAEAASRGTASVVYGGKPKNPSKAQVLAVRLWKLGRLEVRDVPDAIMQGAYDYFKKLGAF